MDTNDEAWELVIATCSLGADGHYYAPYLTAEQSLENLQKFSDVLAKVHARLVEVGRCHCKRRAPQG